MKFQDNSSNERTDTRTDGKAETKILPNVFKIGSIKSALIDKISSACVSLEV